MTTLFCRRQLALLRHLDKLVQKRVTSRSMGFPDIILQSLDVPRCNGSDFSTGMEFKPAQRVGSNSCFFALYWPPNFMFRKVKTQTFLWSGKLKQK